jgi:hypothetical protein
VVLRHQHGHQPNCFLRAKDIDHQIPPRLSADHAGMTN